MIINTLTSLRFLFAIMVFGAHCYILDSFFDAHMFKEGFVGVTFFFVLSGFIIAYNYQHPLQRHEISRRTFWTARFARIYPLHWLTLLFAALAGGFVVATGPLDWLKHFLASLTLTNAYIPEPDYFFSFNSPSWSLCCEQLFYVCFPFLIPLAKSYKRLLWLLLLITPVMLVSMAHTPVEEIKGLWYVNPITRFPDFLVGMLLFRLYEYTKEKPISATSGSILEITAVLLFVAAYLYAAEIPKVYRYSCYYWLPISFVLLSFSWQKGILSRLLNHAWLIKSGEISYSFYLIHLFVLLFYADWQKSMDQPVAWYIAVPVLFGLILLLSLLSYHCFEKPLNKRIKSLLK